MSGEERDYEGGSSPREERFIDDGDERRGRGEEQQNGTGSYEDRVDGAHDNDDGGRLADDTRYGSEEGKADQDYVTADHHQDRLASAEPVEREREKSRSRSPVIKRDRSLSRDNDRRREDDRDYDDDRRYGSGRRSRSSRSRSRERGGSGRERAYRGRERERSRSFDSRDRRDQRRDRGGDRWRERSRDRYVGRARERSWSPGMGGIPNRTPPPRQLHLYVAGLQFDIRDRDLDRKFSRYGKVREARIVRNQRNGESKGFGFVVMDTEDEVRDAIKQLDGSTWRGRRLIVERARTIK